MARRPGPHRDRGRSSDPAPNPVNRLDASGASDPEPAYDDDGTPHISWQPAAPSLTRSQLRARERAAPARRRFPRPHRPGRFTVLLTLAALLLLGWAALCFIDTSHPYLVALISLAPAVSLLALPVVAVAVAGRHVIAAVLALAAAIVPWALVAGSAVAGPGPTSAANHQVLRVLTVDGAAGRASAPTIVRATRNFGVDVLVVTGLSSGLAHDLTVAGLNSVVAPRWVSIPPGTTVGAGLWSLQPIGPANPVPGVSTPATVTQLTTAAGPISLVVAHVGGVNIVPGTAWHTDLQALGAITPPGPRILAGDLGCTPWHPGFRKLRSRGWYEAADVLGRGLRPTWPAWGPVPFAPLDQVMVGGGAGVSRADTITIPGTSHRALLVTVVLPNSGGSAVTGD